MAVLKTSRNHINWSLGPMDSTYTRQERMKPILFCYWDLSLHEKWMTHRPMELDYLYDAIFKIHRAYYIQQHNLIHHQQHYHLHHCFNIVLFFVIIMCCKTGHLTQCMGTFESFAQIVCTVQITFIFRGQTHLVFGQRVCTCVTKHSNAFRTFLNWLKNSKRVWHERKLHILRLPIFANFDL